MKPRSALPTTRSLHSTSSGPFWNRSGTRSTRGSAALRTRLVEAVAGADAVVAQFAQVDAAVVAAMDAAAGYRPLRHRRR